MTTSNASKKPVRAYVRVSTEWPEYPCPAKAEMMREIRTGKTEVIIYSDPRRTIGMTDSIVCRDPLRLQERYDDLITAQVDHIMRSMK